MAVSYNNVTKPGLLAQQYPPPILPKPGKENIRLQKLLKKSAKKKAAPQPVQTPAPFRSNLSPVNEASPDLEHSDHSTPPKTPESPFYGVSQPPRFSVRPLYQHVHSPYPQHRGTAYGRPARFSPHPYVAPVHAFPQHMAPLYSNTPPPRLVRVSPVSVEVTILAPSPVTETVTHAILKPTTVIAPLVKSRSPRPTFKATASSKSPKPMFDVPQIKMYTANTYDIIKSPLYDSAGLTFIGGILPQSKTPTLEIKSVTPTSEVKRGLTPTSEIKRSITPTSAVKRGLTPTSEIKRSITPTSEVKRGLTPTREIKRSITPTSAVKQGLTPTSEIKRSITPTSEVKQGLTPTQENKRPITPTYDQSLSKTSSGRPKTPSYHVTRPKTPVFEVSRPNPLLFAVSPITTEVQRSKTPISDSQNLSLSSGQSLSTPNGDIHLDLTSHGKVSEPEAPRQEAPVIESTRPTTPAALMSSPTAPRQEAPVKESTRPTIPVALMSSPTHGRKESTTPTVSYGNQQTKAPPSETPKPMQPTHENQRPKTPVYEMPKPTTPTTGTQRPKTPIYEPPKSPAHSLGYQRPKTPLYGPSPRTISPRALQRPTTPNSVAPKQKSTYYGLTPAEYVAHGGIQSYAPSFGFSRSKTPTQEEAKTTAQGSEETKTPTQELSVKTHVLVEESKVDVTQKEHKTSLGEAFLSKPAMVLPTIVVSQASDVTLVSSHKPKTAETPKAQTVPQELPRVKTPTSEKPELQISEKERVKTIQNAPKPQTCAPEAKHPVPPSAIKPDSEGTPIVEDKIPPAQKVDGVVTKTSVTQNEKEKATSTESQTKPKEEKPGRSGKFVSAPSASEKEKQGENIPVAEPLLKVIQKPKGMKSKLSGWSRLKKHMVVEVEEPKFPDSEIDATKGTGQEKSEPNEDGKTTLKASEKSTEDGEMSKDHPKATKMWDCVLFKMFSTKENIMQQIEANKSEEDKKKTTDAAKEVPAFAHRLPILLFSPRFDAKRLREAASRPLTKISTVFEMGLIGRKNKDEEPKDFNRTARGFTAS